MPKNTDLKKILIIGSGPINIGQACEFDYSGTQACKALKEEGYKVILINSNPATIMTDPLMADKTYIEPITSESVKKVILKEGVDAILPTVGGQTALNVSVKVAEEDDFLSRHNVHLIGADLYSIRRAENRDLFKKAMTELGFKTCTSEVTRSAAEAADIVKRLDFPVVIRSSFTLGGMGGAIAYNHEEFTHLVKKGLSASMTHEVIIEKSILGWKEYEYEVMKDMYDNVIIICTIENVEPVGVHTGDSVTVAPQQTLTDKEHQTLRNMSIAIIRKIGVSTGGANIQFAVDPKTRDIIVIEMNPRVSRSSALASKATGFPIAKIAAKLAVGYSLKEIPNDITQTTPSCFEPTVDYVVIKMPLFNFEKFSSASEYLGIQMKAVGETMAIGRTFQEAFQKAFRGLEKDCRGFEGMYLSYATIGKLAQSGHTWDAFVKDNPHLLDKIKKRIRKYHWQSMRYIKDAYYYGMSIQEVYDLSKIDPWFLHHMQELVNLEKHHWQLSLSQKGHLPSKAETKLLKQKGFSNFQMSCLFGTSEDAIMKHRHAYGIRPVFKMVDTCAGEFIAKTPYYYSTYDDDNDYVPSKKPKVVILGSGPNRIGQGLEFDYMCVKASLSMQQMGYESIIINSNPETVSTDYDTSDVLFFDPLTHEDVVEIIEAIQPVGIFIQLGGQTPLNLSQALSDSNIPILGTQAESIAHAEDRNYFRLLLKKLGFKQPPNQIAYSIKEAMQCLNDVDFPLLVRPSYVLGGKAMEIVYHKDYYKKVITQSIQASPQKPILIDKYLTDALELDVDAICDGTTTVICGVLEHIEEAGIHSGDSGCVLPPQSISKKILDQVEHQTHEIAKALNVRGFVNVQFAIKNYDLYFIEVNPRGSRTVPFLCKATGINWVDIASKVMCGKRLQDIFVDTHQWKHLRHVSVKKPMFPFDKFPEEDTILGPEMKSTGEVMGIGNDMGEAYYKAEVGAYQNLPLSGGLMVTVSSRHHKKILDVIRELHQNHFLIYATEGTSRFLEEHGIVNTKVFKVGENRPDIRDKIIDQKIDLIFNTPIDNNAKITNRFIRLLAKQHRIPVITTLWGMKATARAILTKQARDFQVHALQDLYPTLTSMSPARKGSEVIHEV